MEEINIKQICSIRKFEKIENDKFVWQNRRKKSLFCKERKEGFYYADWYYNGTFFITEEEILKNKNLYIEDYVVYYKPFLKIKMSNGESYRKYFDLVEDMNDFIHYRLKIEFPLISVDE
jgi:hypothetical protein